MSYYGRPSKRVIQDELAAFVEAAGGEIIPASPGSLPDGEYIIPQDEQWTTGTRENPGNPWAPQPPYFGEELANLVSHTPFDRGQSPDIHQYLPKFDVVQPWRPIFMGAPRPQSSKRNFGYGGYGFAESAPQAPLNKNAGSVAQYKKLAAALAAVRVNIPTDYNKYDATMINAVKQFQGHYMGDVTPSGAYDAETQGALERILKEKDQKTLLDLGQWGIATWLEQLGGSDADYEMPPEEAKTNWPVIIGVGAVLTTIIVVGVAFAVRR